MPRRLLDFHGKEKIFIDANIFLHHAFDVNEESIEFLKRIELSDVRVYTSSLVLEEVYFKILCQAASNYLKKVSVKNIKKLFANSEKKKAVLRPLKEYSQYIEILKISGLKILNLEYEDVSMAVEISSEYGLITADAMHIAVMKRNMINNIATADSDFEIVPWIEVWTPES